MLSLNTNIPALRAIRQVNFINKMIDKTNERLTTGKRINRASDDPSGLGIASRFKYRLNALEQVERNLQNGINATETADTALQQIQSMLQTINTKAIAASDGALTTADRQVIQIEVNALLQEINRVASTATFNGKKLLDGTFSNIKIQSGPNAGERIEIDLPSASTSGLGLGSVDVTTITGAQNAIGSSQDAVATLSQNQAKAGVETVSLKNALDFAGAQKINEKSSLSAIEDADTAKEAYRITKLQIQQMAASQALGLASTQAQAVVQLLRQ